MAVVTPGADVSFWAMGNGAIAAGQRQILSGNLPDFCTNPMHNFNYGWGWLYMNYTCVAPSFAEMHQKMETSIFFLTSFQETWQHMEPDTTFNASTACTVAGIEYDHSCSNETSKTPEDPEICSCSWSSSYFATPVLDMQLEFQHSYQVGFESAGALDMLTMVYNVDRELKYEFDGIQPKLTVREWLNLVGVDDLDIPNTDNFVSEPHPDVIPSADGTYRSPIFRITGLKIKLRLKYSNMKTKTGVAGRGTICQVYVTKAGEWNSRGSLVTYTSYPILPQDDSEQIPYSSDYRFVDRYRYGVTFLFSTEGEIGSTDYGIIIQELINIVVLMQLVNSLVQFVALNLWPEFDSSIYLQQIKSPIAESTRRMYWTKYLYNIAFTGYAQSGHINYENWAKFCAKYGLPKNRVHKCWLEALKNDHDKQAVQKLQDLVCGYRGKYISLVGICSAVRRVPLSSLGRFMRKVENDIVVDIVDSIQKEDEFGRQQTMQASDIRRASLSMRSQNMASSGLLGKKRKRKVLHLNREDYKIFFRDIPLLHEYFQLPKEMERKEKRKLMALNGEEEEGETSGPDPGEEELADDDMLEMAERTDRTGPPGTAPPYTAGNFPANPPGNAPDYPFSTDDEHDETNARSRSVSLVHGAPRHRRQGSNLSKQSSKYHFGTGGK